MDNLPFDILEIIIRELDYSDLPNLRLVNRVLKNATENVYYHTQVTFSWSSPGSIPSDETTDINLTEEQFLYWIETLHLRNFHLIDCPFHEEFIEGLRNDGITITTEQRPTITMFAHNYNILRMMSGSAGLAYST